MAKPKVPKTPDVLCWKCARHVRNMCAPCMSKLGQEGTLVAALTVLARVSWRKVALMRPHGKAWLWSGSPTLVMRNQWKAERLTKYASKYSSAIALLGLAEPAEVAVQRLKGEAKLALWKLQGIL